MKKIIKRAVSFFAVAALVVSFAGIPSSAAADLVFLCINDSFVESLTSAKMPVRINNSMYISYRYLARIRTLKYFYNEDTHILKIYNSKGMLIFDLNTSITYDQDGNIYSYLAERRNGILFVPIEFICRMFDVYYSQIQTDLGMVIRINGISSFCSDEELIDISHDQMQKIYDKYYVKEEEPKPEPPVKPEEEPEEEEIRRTVYPAIMGELNRNAGILLDEMKRYGYKATFFIQEEGLKESSDMLRRIVCEGHSLGLSVSASDPVNQAEKLNEALSSFVMRKTRIVNIKEGSSSLSAENRKALTEKGYRIWDANIDPGSRSRTAQTLASNTAKRLDRAPRTNVLALYTTEASAEAMGKICMYFRQNRCFIREIHDWTVPVNSIRYYK